MNDSISRHRKITWRASESHFQKKTLLWYTNVTVFFLLVLIALFLLQNWIGIVVVSLGAWLFMVKADDRPRTVDFAVDDNGVTIDGHKIDFSELRNFTFHVAHNVPIIILETHNWFTLPSTMIVKNEEVAKVREILLEHLPEEKGVGFLRWLTHWLHY